MSLNANPARMPKPCTTSPFKAGSLQAKQFDAILRAYAIGHRNLIHPSGARCMGNSYATSFWRGYDGVIPAIIPKDSLAYACYRGGQSQRLADNERGMEGPWRAANLPKEASLRDQIREAENLKALGLPKGLTREDCLFYICEAIEANPEWARADAGTQALLDELQVSSDIYWTIRSILPACEWEEVFRLIATKAPHHCLYAPKEQA